MFLEMGLGKTLTTLEILNWRMHKSRSSRTLVLAPKRICDQVWSQEVTRWTYPLSVVNLNGPPAKRLAELENPRADVYLMTYEKLQWLEESGLFPFDTVILDELSKMKNSGSQRWRAFKRIVSRHSPYRLGLTGTPAPNGYPDLWAQMHCLDGGRALGKVKGTYLNKYFTDTSSDPRRYHRWRPRPGAIEAINGLLKKAGVISMRAADVLGQLPPVRLPSVVIDMPAKARAIYRELENELMATMPDGSVYLPEHDGVIQMKLRQVASGFMLDEEGQVHPLHDGKVKALEGIIEEMDGEPLLVVYTYKEELAMIKRQLGHVPYLGGGTKDRDADDWIKAWNRRELPVLLVQPQSAGHGLNLQTGGHNVLFYSADWNLETYQQVIARLDRQGQESTVFVRHLVGGEVEDKITRSLAQKAGVQDGLMRALK